MNRPAYQSSVYNAPAYGGRRSPNLANDGIRETIGVKDNKAWCAVSDVETNPWWAVDLGGPTTIYRVDFTNRAYSEGMYMGLVCSYFVLHSNVCQFQIVLHFAS